MMAGRYVSACIHKTTMDVAYNTSRNNSALALLVMQALIDEDRLLSRLEMLESRLLTYSKVCMAPVLDVL